MGEFSIDHQTTVAGVLRTLRKDIFLGNYQNGQVINELEVSKRFGVSRNTIRSAFQALERDGLLEIGTTGRKTIRFMVEKYFDDLFHTRGVLECEAVRLIINQEKTDFTELLKIVGEFYTVMNDDSETKQLEIMSLNDRFHSQIFELAGNGVLKSCYYTLAPVISIIGEFNAEYNLIRNAHDYYASHKKIVDMLMERNEEVIEYMKYHSEESAYDELLEAIRTRSK